MEDKIEEPGLATVIALGVYSNRYWTYSEFHLVLPNPMKLRPAAIFAYFITSISSCKSASFLSFHLK